MSHIEIGTYALITHGDNKGRHMFVTRLYFAGHLARGFVCGGPDGGYFDMIEAESLVPVQLAERVY